MATSSLVVKIEVKGVPEALWAMRRSMAQRLREAADAEVSNAVAKRLREVANAFEAGVEP